MISTLSSTRSPTGTLILLILIGSFLAIPLFATYLLVYDRQDQSKVARESIVEGWGDPQTLAGPTLIIPYRAVQSETIEQDGKQSVRTQTTQRNLILAAQKAELQTRIVPDRRQRSIYEVVVYEAEISGSAQFSLPPEFARLDIDPSAVRGDRAELRFGVSQPRGFFGKPPVVRVNGKAINLQPGKGLQETGGNGFYAWVDVSDLFAPVAEGVAPPRLEVSFDMRLRGNGWFAVVPSAGDMLWTVRSDWPHPSFQGGLRPTSAAIGGNGFKAEYRLANLTVGQSVVGTQGPAETDRRLDAKAEFLDSNSDAAEFEARIGLIEAVSHYDQINRAVKYGFLFIGFTFAMLFLFDIAAGVRISAVEYLLIGAALVLFFTLLLALAEIMGFAFAYALAAAAIIGLITAYASAVLRDRARAGALGGMLVALYLAIFILLSIEAYSLLIGALLIFTALAAIMYVTRNVDWLGEREDRTPAVAADDPPVVSAAGDPA